MPCKHGNRDRQASPHSAQRSRAAGCDVSTTPGGLGARRTRFCPQCAWLSRAPPKDTANIEFQNKGRWGDGLGGKENAAKPTESTKEARREQDGDQETGQTVVKGEGAARWWSEHLARTRSWVQSPVPPLKIMK